jgi:subtilisin-like proprotein convertase family protein
VPSRSTTADGGYRLRRIVLAALLVVVFSGAVMVAGSGTGVADGPTTFSNTAAIAIPATGSADQTGPASPYPSAVTVAGMNGLVAAVSVTMTGVTHAALNDIDAMLVAPNGNNLTVLSDVGDPGSLRTATNATFTFSDGAASSILGATTSVVPSGTYLPTGPNGPDSFPAPAPAQSSATTFAGAFTGINPNGSWQLFVVDDATGDTGSIAGGWSLTITTAATATTTSATTTTTSATTTTTSATTTTTSATTISSSASTSTGETSTSSSSSPDPTTTTTSTPTATSTAAPWRR